MSEDPAKKDIRESGFHESAREFSPGDIPGSTIFSKNTPVAVRKSSGRRRGLIWGIAAVALLAGVLAFVLRIPPEDRSPPEDMNIRLYSVREVSKIEVTGENSYTLLAGRPGEDGNAALSVPGWDESLPLDTEALVSAYASLHSVTALRKMDDGYELSDYGLDPPAVTVSVDHPHGETTLYFGKMAPDKSGYYLSVKGTSDVYLAAVSLYDGIALSKTDMVSKTAVEPLLPDAINADYFDAASLVNKYDKITLTGENFPVPLVFTMAERGGDMLYRLSSASVTRYANSGAVLSLLSPFSGGLVANSVLAAHPDDEKLRDYNLMNPLCEAAYEIDGENRTLKIGKLENGYSLMIEGREVSYEISTEALSFAEFPREDFYAKKLIVPAKSAMREITFSSKGKSRVLSLRHTAGDVGSLSSTAAFMDGKSLDNERLDGLFASLDALTAHSYDENASKNELLATLTISYEGGAEETFEFYRSSSRRIRAEQRDDGFIMIMLNEPFEALMESFGEN